MSNQTHKYHQAALTYLIYGLVYLSGAVYLAYMDAVARSGWAWFGIGALFVLILPPLIWYEFKWVTRFLAVLVFVRVIGLVHTILTTGGETVPLPGGRTLPMRYATIVFLCVAAVTCTILVRAGWNLGKENFPT